MLGDVPALLDAEAAVFDIAGAAGVAEEPNIGEDAAVDALLDQMDEAWDLGQRGDESDSTDGEGDGIVLDRPAADVDVALGGAPAAVPAVAVVVAEPGPPLAAAAEEGEDRPARASVRGSVREHSMTCSKSTSGAMACVNFVSTRS
jgi:hypothetical protein